MKRLRHHRLNLTRRGDDPGSRVNVRFVLPVLVFLCIALLLLSRLNHSSLAYARWRIAEWMSPVLQAATVPMEPVRNVGRQIAEQVDMNEELRRLRAENQKLANWEWRARELERKLADLEALNKTVRQSKIDFVTARVIADSSGAFVRSVMIDSGTLQNVRSGHPVINGDGLVGRVVETGASSARVLLPTDLNSRIPVAVGRNNVRALLVGDNGAEPRLEFVPPGAVIKPGDDVATSGTGGIFPRGLRVGTVTGDMTSPRVKLRARMEELEYLSVLFYDNPALGLLGDRPAQARSERNETGYGEGSTRVRTGQP